VSKERARRRALREKERAAKARKVARAQRRRAFLRSLVPTRRRTGRLHRRSRAQRTGIVVVPLLAAVLVWWFVPDLSLRIVLTAVIVLVLPALVVALLGRPA
jgi:Flp pilus assembly protein TadB